MNLDILTMWREMGIPVRGVVLVLTIQALMCMTVAVDRIIFNFRAGRSAKRLGRLLPKHIESKNYAEVRRVAEAESQFPFGRLIALIVETYTARRTTGDSHATAMEFVRRTLDRNNESENETLEKGLGVLASTGSTAPFVGLLGTVLGIIAAFNQIAAQGSGGIGTIGASIGEALVVTGYGLLVAIPTVLGYNALIGRANKTKLSLEHGLGEMLDRLEFDGEGATFDAPTQAPAETLKSPKQPRAVAMA